MSGDIAQVRALMREFRKTDLVELKGRAGEWEIFLARNGAGPNPFGVASSTAATDRPESDGNIVRADHLGLFTASLAPGEVVSEGQEIGSLTVLDRKTPVVAPVPGQIISVADDGLVEFGAEIARVAELEGA